MSNIGVRGYYLVTTTIKDNLLNTFLRTDDYPEFKDHIFLLYRFSGVKPFLEYENYLENHELFEFSYDPDRYNTLYCFNIKFTSIF